MNNFILGVDATLYNLTVLLKSTTEYALFWGFAIGFLIATLVHGFLISGGAKNVPKILFKDESLAFQEIYPQQESGKYGVAFSSFLQKVREIRSIFSLSLLFFMLIVLLAIFLNF